MVLLESSSAQAIIGKIAALELQITKLKEELKKAQDDSSMVHSKQALIDQMTMHERKAEVTSVYLPTLSYSILFTNSSLLHTEKAEARATEEQKEYIKVIEKLNDMIMK